MRFWRRGRSAGVAFVAVLALVVVQAALAETPIVRFNAADQAAAKAAVLKLADFGPGWKGGAKKPDLSSDLSCPDYNPKQSDLVVTGAAESEFTWPGLLISSTAWVLKTPRMVQLDWQRTVMNDAMLRCLRTSLPVEDPAGKIVSVKRVPFAKVVPATTRIRVTIDYAGPNGDVRMLMDMVAMARGRTELALIVVGPQANGAAMDAAELRLARIMAGRTRA